MKEKRMRLPPVKWWRLRMIGAAAIVVVGLGLIGCNTAANSTNSTAKTDSSSPGQSATSFSESVDAKPSLHASSLDVASLSEDKIGQIVAVQGEIVEQCPASGCWFRVKDGTGDVFVDLKSIKLRLTEDVVGQRAKVTGRVVKEAGELQVEAQDVTVGGGKDAASSKK